MWVAKSFRKLIKHNCERGVEHKLREAGSAEILSEVGLLSPVSTLKHVCEL
jgi:hypothetical protein